jgi:hypothetical protein
MRCQLFAWIRVQDVETVKWLAPLNILGNSTPKRLPLKFRKDKTGLASGFALITVKMRIG